MPVPLINFPFSAIVDGYLSYLQWIFGKTDITPSDYRWNVDDLKSKIRIGAPFVIDNQKPMSAPFIVVERGPFQFENRTIDDLKSASENTFEVKEKVVIANGYINVICGSSVAGEASSIANFLAINLQADRHGIMDTLRFVRNMYHLDIGPEVPVVKYSEVHRWEVTLRIFCSLQMGWINRYLDPQPWNSATFWNEDRYELDSSSSGQTTIGSDLLVDTTKTFGFTTGDDPQFLESEFDKKWYYLKFANTNELYSIIDVVDSHTLQLETHDINNDPTPYSAPETASGVEYEIRWNNLHIKMELPNNNS